MPIRSLPGRLGVAAAAHAIAMLATPLALGLLGACGAPASNTRSAAWDRYEAASEAYTDCRMRGRAPPPCTAEKAASQAAEARYRAEIGATPPNGR